MCDACAVEDGAERSTDAPIDARTRAIYGLMLALVSAGILAALAAPILLLALLG